MVIIYVQKHISHLSGDTIKAIILVCTAVGVVAVSYGSLAMAYGFPLWVPLALSMSVLAGASEFMFIGIVASGGNPLAAAVAGLLVNARHIPFGVTVRELVGKGTAGFLGCHIMNDESVVFGLSQKRRNSVKRLTGFVDWALPCCGPEACWSALPSASCSPPRNHRPRRRLSSYFAGAGTAGAEKRTTLIRATSGAVASLAAVPFTPVGLPVLLSLLGLLTRKK